MLDAVARALRLVFVPALALTVILLALSCSDDSKDENGGGGQGSFDVSMGDNFYEPNEFTVEPGQKITINLKNDGAAIHNMRIAGADNAFNTEDDALSEPQEIAPGDTGSVVWTAPDEAGEIKLRCEFHPTDSTGTITVE